MKFLLINLIFFISLNASTLTLSMSSSPSRLNPILANDSASSAISDWLFNGLFKYDKDGNFYWVFATVYPTITNEGKKGYLSCRKKATTSEIEKATILYKTLK